MFLAASSKSQSTSGKGRAHGDGSEELLGEVGDELPDDGGRLVTEAVVGQ